MVSRGSLESVSSGAVGPGLVEAAGLVGPVLVVLLGLVVGGELVRPPCRALFLRSRKRLTCGRDDLSMPNASGFISNCWRCVAPVMSWMRRVCSIIASLSAVLLGEVQLVGLGLQVPCLVSDPTSTSRAFRSSELLSLRVVHGRLLQVLCSCTFW